MTLPTMSERKEANFFMNRFRGDESSAGQLAITTTGVGGCVSSEELHAAEYFSRDDFDRFANQEASLVVGSSEEDSYLPRCIPPAIKDLPNMLRRHVNTTGSGSVSSSSSSLLSTNANANASHQLLLSLERHQVEFCERLMSQAIHYILPSAVWNNDLAKWSYGRFGLAYNERDRTNLILECMPFLRRIGILEQAAEFAELKAKESESETRRQSSRRTTRQQAKARRHHYFDKLSTTLRRDEADLNSSEVGALFAKDSLVY